MRRPAIPLLVLALLALALFVALRGTDDGAAPIVGDAARDPSAETTQRVPRARAPEPAPLPPRAIRVAVTSMDGRPVAGARLQLFRGPPGELKDEQFRPTADAPRGEFSAVAGDDGAATFGEVPPARWFVVAEAPGFARHVLVGSTRDADEAVLDTAVALEKGSPFAGTIRDTDGTPAAGVLVVLQPFGPWPSDVACLRTTTDAKGAYRFDAVEAGRYVLWYAARPGFLIEAARVMLPTLDGLDIQMTRGAAIDGVVRDAESGVPIAGARVFGIRFEEPHISGSDGKTTVFDVGTTDHLGRFALHTWRPQFEVTRLAVDAPGYAPTPVDDSGRGPPGGVSEGQRFVFDLRVRRAATLKGTLSTANGPLAGFVVTVRPKDQTWDRVPQSDMWSCVTSADGSFVVDRLPVGPVKVSLANTASGWHSTEPQELDLAAGDAAVHDIRVDVQRVRMTRRIFRERGNDPGEPVEGVDVVQRFGSLSAAAHTDAEGRFTLDAISTGDYVVVELRRGRFRGSASLSSGDEEDQVLFPLIPGSTEVTGALVGPDESPAAGERLDLWSGFEGVDWSPTTWAGLAESVSAADGTFRIVLPSGPYYHVTVRRVGWQDEDHREDGSLRITMPAPVHVVGVAVGEDGAPVADALVRFAGDDIVGRSGADGRFAFTWTQQFEGPPLTISGSGFLWTVVNDADDQRITLVAARSIVGHVRTVNSAAVSGLSVEVREGAATATSATDADGRFVVAGLRGEPCLVTVSDPVHFAFATEQRTATPGSEPVEFVVRPGARLEVAVVGADDKPVGGARVTAHPSIADFADIEAFTPSYDNLELGLAKDAAYTLRVECDGFEPAEQADVRGGGEALRIVLKKKP
jgi:hypothetical protein